jgi:hypothetical protein
MEQDLHSQMKVVFAIEPVIHTAHAVGAEIDTKGYESCEFVVVIGDALDGSFTAIIDQSPDDGAGSPTGVWTAVPAAEVLGTALVISIADTDKVFRIGTIGKERHQRLTLTEVGANTAGIMGAVAILSHPVIKPVAEQYT